MPNLFQAAVRQGGMASEIRRRGHVGRRPAVNGSHAHADESMPQAAGTKAAGRPAFTLTELLIVIAIIAVLAGLAATAAINAMNKARRASISLELKGIANSAEEFKNKFNAYPPNGMNPNNSPSNTPMARMIESDFAGMFKKAFPKHQENPDLIRALCGQSNNSDYQSLENGMTAAEALYFWLGGFSDDELYPISGPRGPSFSLDSSGPGEVIEDRARIYEFDLSRLRPVDDDNVLDAGAVRFIQYPDPKNANQDRRINLWRYHPSGSEQPIVYFDVSRHKPGPFGMAGRYDVWAAGPASGAPPIYAIKQLRRGVTNANNTFNNILFVDQGKCQVLHCGLDDEWGEEMALMGCSDTSGSAVDPDDMILYPTGPFLKETADTLANFLDGTLADAQEANQ